MAFHLIQIAAPSVLKCPPLDARPACSPPVQHNRWTIREGARSLPLKLILIQEVSTIGSRAEAPKWSANAPVG